jgi:hypothetical protein
MHCNVLSDLENVCKKGLETCVSCLECVGQSVELPEVGGLHEDFGDQAFLRLKEEQAAKHIVVDYTWERMQSIKRNNKQFAASGNPNKCIGRLVSFMRYYKSDAYGDPRCGKDAGYKPVKAGAANDQFVVELRIQLIGKSGTFDEVLIKYYPLNDNQWGRIKNKWGSLTRFMLFPMRWNKYKGSWRIDLS